MQFKVTYNEVIRLSAPIAFSLLLPQVSFMANAVFLGRVGNEELVINGICSIFYLLLTYIGFGLSNGILVLLSRRAGQQDEAGMAAIFGNGLFLCLLGAIVLMLLAFGGAPFLFGYSLHDSNIFEGTIEFLYLRIWGLPFLMLSQLMNVFFIAINRSRMLIYGALVANILNVGLDYLLIFGKGGFPKLGLDGAAIASICSEAGYLLVMLGLFWRWVKQHHFPVFRNFKPDTQIMWRTLVLSSPLMLQYIFSIGGWQLFYIYIEHMGVAPLAASHILRSVLGIVGIGTWALASACNTMVSNLIGQGKQHEVFPLVRKFITLSLGYTFILATILACFPETFLYLYTNDPEVVFTGLKSLNILSFSILIMSVATICFNAVIGTGRTRANLVIEVFCVLVYVAYVTVVVEYWHKPLHWAWASEFVYWGCLLLTAGGYLLFTKGKARLL